MINKENIITKDVTVSVNVDNARKALKTAGFPVNNLTDAQIFDKVLGMLGLYGGSAVLKVSEETEQTKKYYFDDWKDSDIIKSQLSPEECDLLDDVLRNSQLIDNRTDDSDDSECYSISDLYRNDFIDVETISKYQAYDNSYVLHILATEDGYHDVGVLIEYVKEFYRVLIDKED